MEHIWSVLCRQSIVDEQSKSVSLIEVIERLTVKASPQNGDPEIRTLPFSAELVTLWTRTEYDIVEVSHGRILIISPDGECLNKEGIEYDVDLTQHQRSRIMGKLSGMPFRGNGLYQFVVQKLDEGTTDWQTVATIPLEIFMETSQE